VSYDFDPEIAPLVAAMPQFESFDVAEALAPDRGGPSLRFQSLAIPSSTTVSTRLR
jgi:hypothetical protein